MSNKAIAALDWQAKNDKSNFSRRSREFTAGQRSLVRDLINENNGSKKNLFDNMYVEKEATLNRTKESDISKLDHIFKLKDPNDMANDLTTAERKYIKFFNKHVDAGFERTLEGKELSHYKANRWEEGNVPLMRQSGRSKVDEERNMAKKIKSMLTLDLNRDVKNTEETFDEINVFLKSKFKKQLTSESRVELLGLDPDGERTSENPPAMETNLEHVLTNFVNDSFKIDELETTLGAYNSMNLISWMDQSEWYNSSADVRKYLDDYVKLVILEEYKDEGKLGKAADKMGSAVSKIAFGFSFGQPILEIGTNTFTSMSANLAQMMMGKQKRFNPKSFTSAGFQIMADKSKGFTSKDGTVVEAMINSYNLWSGDTGALNSDEYQAARKKMPFSKAMFYLNNLPFKFFKAQTFIAELKHIGVMDAHSVDKDGNLTYDYLLDERFKGIFDNKGEVKTGKLNPELAKKRQLFEYLVDKLSLENDGVSPDGKPLRAIHNGEAIAMNDYSRSLYGSMGSDAQLTGHLYAVGRQLAKFKSWAAGKKDTYWTKSEMSKVKGHTVWITDENHEDGGYYDFEHTTMEGIVQTVGVMSNNLLDILAQAKSGELEGSKLGAIKNVYGQLDKSQKENLTRLISDISMYAILMAVMMALFDLEYFKKGEGKLIAKQLHNAASDLAIWQTVGSMSSSSPFAAISYAGRTLGTMKSSLGYVAEGEMNEAGVKFMGITGATKGIAAWAEKT